MAIMLVHWGGYPCDLERIKQIQEKCQHMYGFKPTVIEDCAHAWGAKYKGQLVGTQGNVCCFSFQAIKHFTTCDGGCMVSPDQNHYDSAKLLRWYGLDRTSRADYRCQQDIQEWGFKFHMNNVAAAIGIANYPHVGKIVQQHRDNGLYYNKELKDIGGVHLLENEEGYESSYWVYCLCVDDRENFMRNMKEKGIMVSQVHDRNDKHSCVKDFRSQLPSLDCFMKKMICIPCGWWVGQEERSYIVDCIKQGW
jgi:dTDP-4-amino-4,6-dideoxygalactose transaminase